MLWTSWRFVVSVEAKSSSWYAMMSDLRFVGEFELLGDAWLPKAHVISTTPALTIALQCLHMVAMLFALGSNGSGQLGIGHKNDTSVPQLVLGSADGSLTSLHQIGAGGNHTLFLNAEGHVDGVGEDEAGQCARPRTLDSVSESTINPTSPAHGHAPESIDQVTATWAASILLSYDGRILTCGEGGGGELGLGHGVSKTLDQQHIPNFPPAGASIVQVASAMAHAIAVLDNGDAYGWGKGRKGQLGNPAEHVWSPRKVEGLHFPVVKAACGKDFTILAGDRSTGQLVVLGLTGRDRFGVKLDAPRTIVGWKHIAASWGSVFVLYDDGHVEAWGRDDHGQLPPRDLPPLDAIAPGSEHCLGLTKAGRVLAWGWGEHGNCGAPVDAEGDVKGRWNEVDIPSSPSAVYAGCATSFVATKECIRSPRG